MSIEVLVFFASGLLVRAPSLGAWQCYPGSTVILAVDKASLRILAGYWVMVTGTTSFQVELNCLFTATI